MKCAVIFVHIVKTMSIAYPHLHNLAQGLEHVDNQEMYIMCDMYMSVYV